jgi:hypothetical protein
MEKVIVLFHTQLFHSHSIYLIYSDNFWVFLLKPSLPSFLSEPMYQTASASPIMRPPYQKTFIASQPSSSPPTLKMSTNKKKKPRTQSIGQTRKMKPRAYARVAWNRNASPPRKTQLHNTHERQTPRNHNENPDSIWS